MIACQANRDDQVIAITLLARYQLGKSLRHRHRVGPAHRTALADLAYLNRAGLHRANNPCFTLLYLQHSATVRTLLGLSDKIDFGERPPVSYTHLTLPT